MPSSTDPEYKTLRLIDLKPYEVVAVRCRCGRMVHYPNGYLQRHAKLSSLTLIYDLQFRLRCAHCNSRDYFNPDFGVRFAEYFDSFRDSPWLSHLLKLEVVRQSAIPYDEDVLNRQYTPLRSIERVWSLEVLADAPSNNRLPIRGDF